MKIVIDLFCAAGGASVGYARKGYTVIGVDKVRQRDYPFRFIKMDVMEFLSMWRAILGGFGYNPNDVVLIHASPPCQANSRTKHLRDAQGKSAGELSLNMIPEVKAALESIHSEYGIDWVIENVEGAPDMEGATILCGSMFPELYVMDDTGRRWLKRHRLFLASFDLPQPECDHKNAGVRPLGVYGSMRDNIPSGGQTCRTIEEAQALMGIDWTRSWNKIKLAIPPAYAEWVADQLTY